MNTIVGLIGLAILSVGVGLFDYRIGMCVLGAGFFFDAMLPGSK